MSTHHTIVRAPKVGRTYYGESRNLILRVLHASGWCECEVAGAAPTYYRAARAGTFSPHGTTPGARVWLTVGDLMANYKETRE